MRSFGFDFTMSVSSASRRARRRRSATSPCIRSAFRLRAFDPLALACDGALGVRHENRRVREDDGERGLQLMRGVGHELPLLLPRALHRAQGPAGEEHADHEEDGECDHADAREGEREGLPSVCGADVGERDARDAVSEVRFS